MEATVLVDGGCAAPFLEPSKREEEIGNGEDPEAGRKRSLFSDLMSGGDAMREHRPGRLILRTSGQADPVEPIPTL